MPPPSVRPAMPVLETAPPVVARPNACVSTVELAPRQARLRAHGARVRVDADGPAGSGPLRHASCRCVPMYTAPAGALGRLDVVFIAAAP